MKSIFIRAQTFMSERDCVGIKFKIAIKIKSVSISVFEKGGNFLRIDQITNRNEDFFVIAVLLYTFGVNFINVLRTNFLYECHFSSFFHVYVMYM